MRFASLQVSGWFFRSYCLTGGLHAQSSVSARTAQRRAAARAPPPERWAGSEVDTEPLFLFRLLIDQHQRRAAVRGGWKVQEPTQHAAWRDGAVGDALGAQGGLQVVLQRRGVRADRVDALALLGDELDGSGGERVGAIGAVVDLQAHRCDPG